MVPSFFYLTKRTLCPISVPHLTSIKMFGTHEENRLMSHAQYSSQLSQDHITIVQLIKNHFFMRCSVLDLCDTCWYIQNYQGISNPPSPGLLFPRSLPLPVSSPLLSLPVSYLPLLSRSFSLISSSSRSYISLFPQSLLLFSSLPSSLSFLSLYPPFHCFFHPFFISLPSHPHLQKTYCHNLLFRRMKPVSMRSANNVKII